MAKKTEIPRPGDVIEITARKVGDKVQPLMKTGHRFVVVNTETVKDANGKPLTVVIVKHPTAKGRTLRVRQGRFVWKVMTVADLETAKFRKEIADDTETLIKDFTHEERIQIAVVPLIYYHIIWHYTEMMIQQSITARAIKLKKLNRQIRETKMRYERFLAQDLDTLHTRALEKQTDDFLGQHKRDEIILFYTVNGEFKKYYPKHDYDEVRTYAVIALLMFRLVEQHNRRMDTEIAKKMGSCKATLLMPAMQDLKTLVRTVSGIDSRFDFDTHNIDLCVKIFTKNIEAMEFNLP